ncbi:MAG: response regulator [Rhodothermales bacterium]|nr:response regulator [Rhodothermales bacterium]
MENELLHLLLVEDDEDDFFIARRLLERAATIEAELDWVTTYEEGLDGLCTQRYDVALVDYRLGARNGLELLREAVATGCETPVILLTGQGDREVDLQAMVAGASDYLVKWEFDVQLLERSIRYAVERKRADERIRQQAAFLDKARDAISAYDLDGHVIYWNKSAERLTGYPAEAVQGQRINERLYEPDAAKLREAERAVKDDGEWGGELRQRTRGGEEVVVESRWTLVRDGAGNPRSVLVINTDVTERKQLETQFLRAQRMESIGRLVSGIAHDLGNLLVPIMLGVKVLQQRFSDDERTLRTLNMIHQSGQRGSDMVKQVLAFARGVQGERVPLPPDQVVHEVEKMARETFPSPIEVETDLPEGLWQVKGDATQIQQVLMNLCVNARDAMPEGGRLTLRAENVTLNRHLARMHLDAQPGDYVMISVSDTGEGIPPEVLDKIFEPFYTTKPVGKGTGLGLSTVYSILKSHGGFANVRSEVGMGTTFQVYLPVAEKEAERRTEPGEPAPLREGRGELVLVIDDEPFIRETARETLLSAGYEVVTAEHGREGLAVFDAHADEVAVVVTDIMMPELGGIATIRALRERSTDVPILAVSGMADGQAQEALDAGANQFMAKPFTAEKLCAALDDLLTHDVEN